MLATVVGPQVDVVVGSTHVADIVRDLSAGSWHAHVLVEPSMCPSNFDMKMSDIETMKQARAVILHDWQREMAAIRGTIEAAKVLDDHLTIIAVTGNWLAPPVQVDAIEAVVNVMVSIDPERASVYNERAQKRITSVDNAGAEAKTALTAATETNVICNEILRGFVEWIGFNVVGVYGRTEEVSPAALCELVRRESVQLVIGNLQSGDGSLAATIARETGAESVILTNFPGGLDHTDTWHKTFEKDMAMLREAVSRCRLHEK